MQVGRIEVAHLRGVGDWSLPNDQYDYLGPMNLPGDSLVGGRFFYRQSHGTTLGPGLEAATAGVFRIDATFRMLNNHRMVMRALVDGTPVKYEWGPAGTTYNRTLAITHTARLDIGQRLGVQVRQDSGDPSPREAVSTFMTLTYLGQ